MPRPLNPLNRTRSNWVFAKGSEKDSVGAYRGLLHPSKFAGGIYCWSGAGEALRWFDDSLKGSILDFLRCHCDKVQESSEYLAIELFMVGKKAERARPVVMFISDDKAARKEAFDMVKESDILDSFPDFELGHADLGKIMALAGEGVDVSCFVDGTLNQAVLQLVRDPVGDEQERSIATAGGIITHCGRYMILTVDHFLDAPNQRPPTSDEKGSDTSDCEITGLEDFDTDEDDNESIDVTSKGSLSDQESISDRDVDSPNASVLSSSAGSNSKTVVPFAITAAPVTSSRGSGLERPTERSVITTGQRMNTHDALAGKRQILDLGRTVAQDWDLDYNLIEIDPSSLPSIPKALIDEAIPLTDETMLERIPREAAVWTVTPAGGVVRGFMSGSVHHIRFPQSKKFTEVYMAKFPPHSILPGDCGSWIRDTGTSRLYGHVIAGSPASGEVAIMPAKAVFRHARLLNSPRSSSRPPTGWLVGSQAFADAIMSRDKEAIETHLQNWADPNIELDNVGTRAIHYAAFHCDIELLRLLKLYGAVIDSKCVDGHSILFFTICSRDRLLLTLPRTNHQTWANIRGGAKNDNLVLRAIKTIFKGPSTWEVLASILNVPDFHGVTPLMAAAEQGRCKTVSYLLEQGADPGIKDRNGSTAYVHAATPETARLLLKATKRTATTKNSESNASRPTASTRPPSSDPNAWAQLFCEFHNLGEASCKRTFHVEDGEDWVRHHIDHLRLTPGSPPDLPARLCCWFCDCVFVAASPEEAEDRLRSFGRRMRHIYLHIAESALSDDSSSKQQARQDPLMAYHVVERGLLNRVFTVVKSHTVGHRDKHAYSTPASDILHQRRHQASMTVEKWNDEISGWLEDSQGSGLSAAV